MSARKLVSRTRVGRTSASTFENGGRGGFCFPRGAASSWVGAPTHRSTLRFVLAAAVAEEFGKFPGFNCIQQRLEVLRFEVLRKRLAPAAALAVLGRELSLNHSTFRVPCECRDDVSIQVTDLSEEPGLSVERQMNGSGTQKGRTTDSNLGADSALLWMNIPQVPPPASALLLSLRSLIHSRYRKAVVLLRSALLLGAVLTSGQKRSTTPTHPPPFE